MMKCCRKKNVGKPCEGEPHARFDDGKEGLCPLTYSTTSRLNLGIDMDVSNEYNVSATGTDTLQI